MFRGPHDVIVVGGGIAGILVTARLLEAGLRVALLEAGAAYSGESERGWLDYLARFHGSPAKVPNAPYPANAAAPSPSVLDVRAIGAAPAAEGYFVQRGPDPFRSDYVRALGGTTLHWLGTCLRMVPSDFRMRSAFGRGIDWPFDNAALAPWYEEAEWMIGVAGDAADQAYHGIEFGEDYAYPMRPIPPSWNDARLSAAIEGGAFEIDGESIPLSVTGTPAARNSAPRRSPARVAGHMRGLHLPRGGSAAYVFRGQRCEGNSSCIPICPVQAKYSALRTLRDILRDGERSARLTLVKQCVVSRLEFDPESGTATGVLCKRYAAPERPADFEVVRFTGRAVVLAANAVENAKLALASGLRDASGELGGNLMDHPFILSWGSALEPVGAFRGPGATSGIESFRDGRFRARRAAFRVEIGNWGWNLAADSPTSDVVRLARREGLRGAALRRRLRREVGRQVRLGALVEQPPDTANRVSIDPAQWRDRLGEPRPVIDYRLDDYTKAGVAFARAACAEVFRRAGIADHTRFDEGAARPAGWIEFEDGEFGYRGVYYGSGHLVGTHRIAAGPTTGVLDPDLRCWQHPNVWMVGAGAMPTIGTSNPTLTLAALALKASHNIIRSLTGGAP